MRNMGELVSCCAASPYFHGRQETIRKRFPMAMIHNALMPSRKLVAKSFPMVMIAKVPTADGKLFAKGFLWQ